MRSILSIFILMMYSIGLGVAILPPVVGLAGIWYGFLAAVAVWLFVLVTGLIYLEATLANPDGANVMTISRNFLGQTGSTIGSVAYIYAHTTIVTIYFLYGTLLISDLTEQFWGFTLPLPSIRIALLVIAGTFIFLGIRYCGWLCGLCACGFLSILFFIFNRGEDVLHHSLHDKHWVYLLLSIPILYDTLFFQTIVPSLATFLKRDWVKIKRVIWIGSAVALLITLFWIWIVIGLTADTTIFLEYQSYDTIYGVAELLRKIPLIGNTIYLLTLFSFLATFPLVGLVLLDFYSDVFKLSPEKRKGAKRLGICCLTLIPPFILSHLPMIHIEVLINYTLGLTILIISTLFPLFWIISARYIQHVSYPHRLKLKGSDLILYSIATFFLLYIQGVQLIKL